MFILRNEPFGGSVFDTTDGTLIHLDPEGFAAVCRGFRSRDLLSEEERVFFEKVRQEFPRSKDGEAKLLLTDLKRTPAEPFLVTATPEIVDFEITYRCDSGCPHCYVESVPDGFSASLNDVLFVLDELVKARVLQIAFGGGEPTLHPDFPDILKETYEREIVPNFTTNGKYLTDEILEAANLYCGAVALSVEEIDEAFAKRRGFNFDNFLRTAEFIRSSGIRLVFQVMVSVGNIMRLPQITSRLLEISPSGFLFLAYKPVGRGRFYDAPLSVLDPDLVNNVISKVMDELHGRVSIGFDCCFAPGLARLARERGGYQTYEGCAAGRTTLAVNPHLDVLPCSFIKWVGGNLKSTSLSNIWAGPEFRAFRNKIKDQMSRKQCIKCKVRSNCLGGCPMMNLLPCTIEGS